MEIFERIAGCLLGGAVGDALGAPVEFMSISEIRAMFGSGGIEHYAPAYGKVGAITDDTQMTLFTLEGLLISRLGDVSCQNSVRDAYIRWLGTQGTISKLNDLSPVYTGWLWQRKALHSCRAPGNACLSSLKKHLSWMERNLQIPDDPINDSKGCGGIMRIAPVGFFDVDCFTLGCDLAKLTHGHPSGYLASGFLAHLIYELICGANLSNAIDSAKRLLVRWPSHKEVLQAVDRAVSFAQNREPTPEIIEQLGGGWVAEEALAISLLCALKAQNFAHGVRIAVNHGGDSDSTGAITGNILGAMWGRNAIPDEFLKDLELRYVIEQMALDAANVNFPDEWSDRYVCLGESTQKADTAIPFDRSYWVKNGTFLAGYYPGDTKMEESSRKLNGLLDVGIRTIINLMLEDECGYNGKPFVKYEDELMQLANARGLTVHLIRRPIPDLSAPASDYMKTILDDIDTSIAQACPVYVHCRGGMGRTGAVVGCWLARHGVAKGNDAITHIKHLRRNEALASELSPQTSDQCDLVRSWSNGR